MSVEMSIVRGYFLLIKSNNAFTFSSITATRRSSLDSTMMSVIAPRAMGHIFKAMSKAVIAWAGLKMEPH